MIKQYIDSNDLDTFLEVEFINGKCTWNKELQRKLSKALGIKETNYPQEHLITIGKMIEFIESKYMIGINNFIGKKYRVKLIKSEYEFEPTIETEETELADALWEACTFILED